MKVSIVVPVYASQDCLEELARRIEFACAAAFDTWELILVNDGSPDDSWSVIRKLAARHDNLVGLNLRRNRGQDNALMAGLRYVTGDIVVIMDDDLQHDPDEIPGLVAGLGEGHDVAYADFGRLQQAFWKRLGSRFNDRVAVWLLGKPADVYMSPFKAIRRAVVDEIVRYRGPFPYVDGLIFTITDNTTRVPAHHRRRFSGHGHYDLRRSVLVWLKLATGFSVVPLRIVSLAGAAIAIMAMLVGAYYLVEAMVLGLVVEGWLSLMVGVFFLGGIQLLALGTVGEYIGRILITLNRQPQYSVSEVVGELSPPGSSSPHG